MKIFTGNSNHILSKGICDCLGLNLGEAEVKAFSDGEISVKIKENIRGKDVFVIQSTNTPHTNFMELLIMIDALKRASARRITAVIPYYGYGRQDRKDRPRAPITAKLVADLLTVSGASRILCLDLHADQIQGFFNIPVDHLYGSITLAEYFHKKGLDNLTIVAPDPGSIKLVRGFAKRLKASLAFIDKRRPRPNVSEVLHIIGDVSGRNIILIDDMIDTSGTICNAAQAMVEAGALEIYAGCTHPILSGAAKELIDSSPIRELVITDSIQKKVEELPENTTVLSVAPLFAEAIYRIHKNESVSSLFD